MTIDGVKTDEERWQEWLASRPEKVKKLAEEFPRGTYFDCEERIWYLLGYLESEEDMLIISATDPWVNFDEAVRYRQFSHTDHLREFAHFR